jgi:pimeloyl-ACP methyl ester carboxylesterase
MLSVLFALVLASPGEVLVTTTAGVEHGGRWQVGVLELKADFGLIRFNPDSLALVEFGQPDRVTLADGRDFEGELDLVRLQLESKGGIQTFPVRDLASVQFLVDGRPLRAADFSGMWATSFGPMQLEQRGLDVTGTYGFRDEYSLTGTVEPGGELHFVGREPGGESQGVWKLWEDGRTFSGRFRFAGGDERFWGAYRIAPHIPEPVPGEVVSGQTGSWLNYHLRVPPDWDPGREWPAIAFFHGSNMNSRAYIDTIVSAWPDLADEFVLVGIDGEKLSSRSDAGQRFFNYSYVNFSGHGIGQPWRHRQSPGLVADALQELGELLPISKWLIGGHSQGGFLTYALVMYYPELIAGAFPMSCNLLVQCEPDGFEDEGVRAAQRSLALAPIHGREDTVVEFSAGQYCVDRLRDGGFPTLRFFAPERVGHQFAWLPVEPAVRWLDAMTSGDALRLLELAEGELDAGRFRSATAAALRAQAAGATTQAVERLHARVDAAATGEAARLLAAIEGNEDGTWVPAFLEFRASFAFTPVARPVMEAYAALRTQHAGPADEAFYGARREQDPGKREPYYRRIVEQFYASKWYPLVRGWL